MYVRISLELLWGVKRDGRLVWHPDLVPAQIAIDT